MALVPAPDQRGEVWSVAGGELVNSDIVAKRIEHDQREIVSTDDRVHVVHGHAQISGSSEIAVIRYVGSASSGGHVPRTRHAVGISSEAAGARSITGSSPTN